MSVQRRPVHSLVARTARPSRVPATMTETRLMADEDLAGAERVPVRAAAGRVGNPLPVCGLHEVAEHTSTLSLAGGGEVTPPGDHPRPPPRRGRRYTPLGGACEG
jgi:hypothetical protein